MNIMNTGTKAMKISYAVLGIAFKKGSMIDFEFKASISDDEVSANSMFLDNIYISITAIIGPVAEIPTSPKLSSSDNLLSFLIEDTPTESAKINGTVKAPVAAPDESKAIARNSGVIKNDKINMIKYIPVKILLKGKFSTILIKPRAIIIAIPIDTIKTILEAEIFPVDISEICSANIIKSGSAIEIKNPKVIPANATIQILFDLAIEFPIKLPMGVIPISTPNKNIDSPKIIRNAPIKNRIIIGVSRGAIVKLSIRTIIDIGMTDKDTSFSF